MQALAPVALTGNNQLVPLSSQGYRDGGSIRIANESQYALQINLGGAQHWLSAWTADLYELPRGIVQMTVVPSLLTALGQAPSSQILITLGDLGETIPGTYPVALTRQLATASLWTAVGSKAAVAGIGVDSFNTSVVPVGSSTLAINAPGLFTTFLVKGNQTGAVYGVSQALAADWWTVPINGSADTTFNIQWANLVAPSATIAAFVTPVASYLPPLGPVSSIRSLPVVIALDQATFPVTATVANVVAVAGSQGASLKQDAATGYLLDLVAPLDGTKATYSAGFRNLVPVAGVTDLVALIAGTKKVKLLRVNITGTKTTAGYNDIALNFRSTLDTGGTPTTLTALPHDPTDAAATAIARSYAAVPTPGTGGNTFREDKLLLNAPAATTVGDRIVWDFTSGMAGKAPDLAAGSTQMFAIQFPGGPTITGGLLSGSIEWTEE